MKKLSTEQLQAAAETLRRVQAKLARSGNLPLEPTVYASAKGFRRNVPEYVWTWLSGLLAPHRAWLPGWTRIKQAGAMARHPLPWCTPARRRAGSTG